MRLSTEEHGCDVIRQIEDTTIRVRGSISQREGHKFDTSRPPGALLSPIMALIMS